MTWLCSFWRSDQKHENILGVIRCPEVTAEWLFLAGNLLLMGQDSAVWSGGEPGLASSKEKLFLQLRDSIGTISQHTQVASVQPELPGEV